MAIYKYLVVSQNGRQIEGEREAEDRESVVSYLQSQGVTIVSIREDFKFDVNKMLNVEIGGLSLADKVLFSKQLATMISAGIPIIQAIDILRDQEERSNIKKKYDEVYKIIESGIPLSQAFEKVGGVFSEVQINLIAAGEKSGNLNEMLGQVAVDLEKSKSLRGKLIGALIYPTIIFFVLIGVMAIMILFMVPQVTELYGSLGEGDAELPLVTRLLVRFGEALGSPISLLMLIGVIASVVFLYKYYTGEKSRKLKIDRLKLKIPVFGNLSRKIELTQFSRLIGMLVSSGVPIIEALGIVSRAMGNSVFSNVIDKATQDVTKGSSMSVAIAKNNEPAAFPGIMVKIVATGEEAGQIDKVLKDMADYYETEVNQITENLTKLLEPFILVFVGIMVAFLAIAIYLPIYNVANLF